ncbi:MAG: prolipoprotein diacylglyceryl transferase, partial [Erysipelotrichaceae bacterium]|nr:prolipoprotein diacylglyceryl transferase [Erysipelotrichaceae bacterium]
MEFFPNPKTFLAIGPLSIQWYAVLIIIGISVAYVFSKKDFKENGYKQETLDDLLIGCLLCGIICARLWFCLFWDAEYYFSDISHLLDIRGGGLAIQGGLIGGSLYGLYYAKKHKMSFFRGADVVATNILISQAIGRWGNFINQEAYGQVVSEAYFNWAPAFIKEGMFINGEYRQPTFLWESILDLLGFIVLRFGYKKYGHGKRGDMTCLYLMWYGVSRFIVESFRTDNLMFLGLRMSRVMALLFVIVGACGLIFIRLRKNHKKPVVLFDLDGTLLDTKPAILDTYRHLFAKYDKEENFTEAVQIEVQGPPLVDMF